MLPGWRRALRAALQRGQSDPFAATQLGFSASSGRAWRLWAARHSQEEAGPLGAQPLPRVLELTASKAAYFTAFEPSRHCDNSCFAGKGERCNGRRLTCILYLNPEWVALHGGELRIFEPFAPKHRPAAVDVAPIIDRLIIFYADYRVPHEVLPSHAERYAITLWYFDGEERERAQQTGAETTAETNAAEADAIQDEIRRFEARYGPATEKRSKAPTQ